jgi:transcriptional regulator GlxA family with amidase domain
VLAEADTIILPAGIDAHFESTDLLFQELRHAHERGTRIVAMNSGVFVLAAAGLLTGRLATTHYMLAEELRRRYPDVAVDSSILYVEDDAVFTSAGAAAGLDLCIELVRRDHGVGVANALAERIAVPLYRNGRQAQTIPRPHTESSEGLVELLDWALARLDQPLTLADLARAAHMTPRTLARRFHARLGTTPLRWLLHQRIRLAQQLLETTDKSVAEIATLAGLGSPANFRHQFSRIVGISPRSYRRSFAPARPLHLPSGFPRSATEVTTIWSLNADSPDSFNAPRGA